MFCISSLFAEIPSMIWWFHCPNLIISTTLQSDLFSPTKTPRFCVVIGTRKVVIAHQKGNQWRRRSPIRRCPTMLQARWKKLQKKTEKPWGILTSEMVFLKIEFGWYVMYVVWKVCDECFPILFFCQRFITQVMGPLSHPLTSAWVQVQRCISGWNGWATAWDEG